MKKLSPWVVFAIVLVVIAIIVLIIFLLLSEAEKVEEAEDVPAIALHLQYPGGISADGKNAVRVLTHKLNIS